MIHPKALQRLKALSSETRIQILEILSLSPEPLMVEMIAARLNRPQSSISRHISTLKKAGIITAKKSGRSVLCELVDDPSNDSWWVGVGPSDSTSVTVQLTVGVNDESRRPRK